MTESDLTRGIEIQAELEILNDLKAKLEVSMASASLTPGKNFKIYHEKDGTDGGDFSYSTGSATNTVQSSVDTIVFEELVTFYSTLLARVEGEIDALNLEFENL
jgi:hypothetical protein